jgi:colanic acid biosynthesis glycosyl transferase WcaI
LVDSLGGWYFMRILIVTQYFWPESFLVNDLALGLQERGHEITVLTGVPNYPQGRIHGGYGMFSPVEENYRGVRTLRVPMLPRGDAQGMRLMLNYLSFALSASCLGPYRCRKPYDLVLAFQPSPITVGLPALLLKWLRTVPMLLWVQDLWPQSLSAAGAIKSPWVLKQVDRLVRSIYHGCDQVLVQSPGFIPHVTAQGVPAERVQFFPNWAESFYQPLDLPEDAPERKQLPQGFCLLYAGNIGVSQSFPTILEAAELTRDCPDLHWVLMGEGRQKAWLEAQVATRNLSKTVHLLPGCPATAMPAYFAAADALLVTLKRDDVFELTIPSKLQPYLACGRPILAALNGEGAALVEESGAGLVAPAENAPALAARARELYVMDSETRSAMGRQGRRYFDENFEREMLLDRLESILQNVGGRVACAA